LLKEDGMRTERKKMVPLEISCTLKRAIRIQKNYTLKSHQRKEIAKLFCFAISIKYENYSL
jgi:hypothetical protein